MANRALVPREGVRARRRLRLREKVSKEAPRPGTQEEAGSAHVAVPSVGAWDDLLDALQPEFDLTADAALERVLAPTRISSRHASIRPGFVLYVVRMQVTLLPRRRGGAAGLSSLRTAGQSGSVSP